MQYLFNYSHLHGEFVRLSYEGATRYMRDELIRFIFTTLRKK